MSKIFKICLVLLLLVGSLSTSLTMLRSGNSYPFGIGFWGPNGHDGIWHLALINQVTKDFPPPHPTFAGEKLTNYHFLYDYLVAGIHQLTGLSTMLLYFKLFPLVLSLLLGYISFLFGSRLTGNKWVGWWFAFLNYFAGSFGFLVTLLRDRQWGGESLFWSMQSASTQINPPFALSLVVLLLGLTLLTDYKHFSLKKTAIIGLVFGMLFGIKSYAGVLGLVGLSVFCLYHLIHREYYFIWLMVLPLVLTAVTFLLTASNSSGLFVFQPFWFVHSMIESTDRFYWPRLASLRYTLSSTGFPPLLFVVELMGLLIFIFGNLGTRIAGLTSVFNAGKQAPIWLSLISIGLTAFIIPLLYIQKGTPWNTIQFFYYFLVIANLYFAMTLNRLFSSRKLLKILFALCLVILSVPTTCATLYWYLGWPPPASLPEEEIMALKYLQKQPDGVVLTYPFQPEQRGSWPTTPLPLRIYETSGYVSAFSGKQTFLEDEINLAISDFPWQERRQSVEKFWSASDFYYTRNFLNDNKISYVYLVKPQVLPIPVISSVKQIYENSQTVIYQAK